ncbi:MAG: ribulose-phosphate 3-epimerase [Clostridiaceae bacterium]|nr:ribulose-phosphate 3-epimerase [Clostridiaceae bacterium]
MIKIAPSILAADFAHLAEQIKQVEEGGADLLHIDVMDGHFVPNITIGPPVIEWIRRYSDLEFDVHLMIDNPEKYIESFVNAGADSISVHAEATVHLHRCIQMIKKLGVKACVALNPSTPLDVLDYVMDDIEMVLLMTVNPGFGGQTYIPAMTRKIESLKKKIDDFGKQIDIQIDGGIGLDNIYEVTKAGANVIVAGSAVYRSDDIAGTIQALKSLAYGE